MRALSRLVMLSLAFASVATAAAASDADIYTPGNNDGVVGSPKAKADPAKRKPKPAPISASIAGTWSVVTSCGTANTWHIAQPSPDDVSGDSRETGNNGTGTITGGSVVGSTATIRIEYLLFGKAEDEVWTATLSNGNRLMTGAITGALATGCKFTATKQ